MSDGKAGNCEEMIVTHMAMLYNEGTALVPADAPKGADAFVFTFHEVTKRTGPSFCSSTAVRTSDLAYCEGVCLDQGWPVSGHRRAT